MNLRSLFIWSECTISQDSFGTSVGFYPSENEIRHLTGPWAMKNFNSRKTVSYGASARAIAGTTVDGRLLGGKKTNKKKMSLMLSGGISWMFTINHDGTLEPFRFRPNSSGRWGIFSETFCCDFVHLNGSLIRRPEAEGQNGRRGGCEARIYPHIAFTLII